MPKTKEELEAEQKEKERLEAEAKAREEERQKELDALKTQSALKDGEIKALKESMEAFKAKNPDEKFESEDEKLEAMAQAMGTTKEGARLSTALYNKIMAIEKKGDDFDKRQRDLDKRAMKADARDAQKEYEKSHTKDPLWNEGRKEAYQEYMKDVPDEEKANPERMARHDKLAYTYAKGSVQDEIKDDGLGEGSPFTKPSVEEGGVIKNAHPGDTDDAPDPPPDLAIQMQKKGRTKKDYKNMPASVIVKGLHSPKGTKV